jgi:hypothetical protein
VSSSIRFVNGELCVDLELPDLFDSLNEREREKFVAFLAHQEDVQAAVKKRVADEAAERAWDGKCEAEVIVELIEKAGLLNLANGVQLGATTWCVHMSQALEAWHSINRSSEKVTK